MSEAITKSYLQSISEHDRKMLISFYVCFDRPAFRENFEHETDLNALIDAIDDTIAAINTGVKKRRDGIVFGEATDGKAYFESKELRKVFDCVVNLLSEAKFLYFEAKGAGYFFDMSLIGRVGIAFHSAHTQEAQRVAVMIDELRNRVLETINNIYVLLGMEKFPYIKTSDYARKLASLPPLKKEKPKAKYNFWSLNDIVELKPNFFGIGININELLKRFERDK